MPLPSVDAYRTQTITTADPVTLVTMLYEGALKAVRKAGFYHESGRRSECFDNTGRAVLIIGELMAALDMERGEIAEGLSSLYGYCMRRLAEATWDEVPAAVEEVDRHLVRVTEAWKQATVQYRALSTVAIARGVAA